MAAFVLIWAFVGYGLLAAILISTIIDLRKSRYWLALFGVIAIFVSPYSASLQFGVLGIIVSGLLMGVTGILTILFLYFFRRRTKTTALNCFFGAALLAFAIGCDVALIASGKSFWAEALPEVVAVFYPVMMMGGTVFIFYRAVRRFVYLRDESAGAVS